MKNVPRFSGIIILLSILIYSCEDKPSVPVLTTRAASEVTYTTATSGGDITNDGGAPVVSKGICWSTATDPTISESKTTESGGLGAFTSNLTQLSPNTLYYVRAYATNSAGTGYGNQVTFATSQVEVPILTTTAITAITQTTAASGGNITNDKGGPVTARGVCWNTLANPTLSDSKTSDGTGTGSFVSNLIGLQPGTVYYVRSYATNSVGTSYGNEISFSTLKTVPTVTTAAVFSIIQTTAISGGNITSDGGVAVTARGVCWGTSENPTISLSTKTTDGTGTGTFTSSIIGLTPNTLYYIRAYATNSEGTQYGNVISFTTQNYGAVSDIDGNMYKTIIIGTQTWMAENLKTTKYNDGTDIPLVTDGEAWAALTTPGYCWYNNDAATYKATYGAMYNWYAVDAAGNRGKNVCPTGWHVSTNAEWHILIMFLDASAIPNNENQSLTAGGKLKETGTTHWQSPNTGASNETGFTALPGGTRSYNGVFNNIFNRGFWWSATENDAANAYYWSIGYNYSAVFKYYDYGKYPGFSVRCIKDN